ncbi:cation:proton antiporter [candidate division MSBL1 archaeon SCGC-AAA259I09]|uniref:Cation:proton antiporter n=3 Tax=candidate division MSBL1 TaxID=215777 RepID=A0A133UQG8_9EURY|nr:cation:proton antiporter [candidate division MSBL1 archaeon SCGC-AAA259D14]KXA93377.1 cation:proton antiporter [candidate division MSBL1 archaeon SCGC-AAA259E22]KXA96448.1 cation:proton antiporter [candidate division MSBL1 archaeon SCGC-AAA259I09]
MFEENFLVSPLVWIVVLLILTSFLLLYRIVSGPTPADRIVALNTVSTKVIIIVVLLAVLNREFALIDLAIVLLMINGVSSLILAKYLHRG